ncbi:MAG: hypothetical protein ACREJB_14345 [Planctomycetaceae bacterium]
MERYLQTAVDSLLSTWQTATLLDYANVVLIVIVFAWLLNRMTAK